MNKLTAYLEFDKNKLRIKHKIASNFYPSGKPRAQHLLCCQGFAVKFYSFSLGRLEAVALSAFETLGSR